jgi:signal transduction histidine kinase
MLGIAAAQTRGTLAADVIADSALRHHLAAAHHKKDEELATDLELYDHQRREVRAIQARSSLTRDLRGEVSGFLTILLDTTQVREMDRLKSEFIATAAHELRTPLTVIIGYAELLGQQEEEFSAEQQKEFTKAILDRAEALSEIVDDLLDLSRIEAGRLISLNRRPCPLAPLITQLVDHYQQTSPRHRFEKQVSLPGPVATADPAKISQVLENLLSNAVKYSPSGGRISITLDTPEDQCLISVADEGIGMTTEQTQRIFDKFYRADVSDSAVGGLGLGMAITKAIVEGHDGRIWVESTPGQGTKVSFTLPRRPPDSVSESPPSAPNVS